MKKPQFPHCNTIFTISWILTIPLLINICTGCNLFSFWVSWILFILVLIISVVRLVFGFKQGCTKFCWGLIGELALGAIVLGFFQLSFNNVIKTPVSNPVTPAVVDIAPPSVLLPDSVQKKDEEEINKLKTLEKSVEKPINNKEKTEKSKGDVK